MSKEPDMEPLSLLKEVALLDRGEAISPQSLFEDSRIVKRRERKVSQPRWESAETWTPKVVAHKK
jgi:hypothetical protein